MQVKELWKARDHQASVLFTNSKIDDSIPGKEKH